MVASPAARAPQLSIGPTEKAVWERGFAAENTMTF